MPVFCSAFHCNNRRSIQTRSRGITFHKFPKDPGLRKAWTLAVRRLDFKPNNTTVLCSCHFRPEDFDRTGQTVRLKEGVVPSEFPGFPDHLKKVIKKARVTLNSRKALEARPDPVPVPVQPQLNPSVLDHNYTIDVDQLKTKLIEAQARAEDLQRQLRNAKIRERRRRREENAQ
ncbi:THAP domain-containing protein 6-like isoform X3 [Gouania willdenowi]|uniref:THAP domain-containing protein 6-like isoform X3 n=1 Tax=Gouania willdenowi TaxID=441366 RepID=UPI001054DAD8|nr:THAP domain-containing protein 6-like isoform X3 [Gouania willdenowi]